MQKLYFTEVCQKVEDRLGLLSAITTRGRGRQNFTVPTPVLLGRDRISWWISVEPLGNRKTTLFKILISLEEQLDSLPL